MAAMSVVPSIEEKSRINSAVEKIWWGTCIFLLLILLSPYSRWVSKFRQSVHENARHGRWSTSPPTLPTVSRGLQSSAGWPNSHGLLWVGIVTHHKVLSLLNCHHNPHILLVHVHAPTLVRETFWISVTWFFSAPTCMINIVTGIYMELDTFTVLPLLGCNGKHIYVNVCTIAVTIQLQNENYNNTAQY